MCPHGVATGRYFPAVLFMSARHPAACRAPLKSRFSIYMSLKIYNTLARRLQAFEPLEPGHVRMYVCGMTIYDLCHIGHARMLERGITLRELTTEMTEAMHQDIAALGIEPPTLEPRATDHVPQMLGLIERLEAKGLAYRAEGGDVNFSVRKFPGYGKLSGKSLDDLRAGERVAVDGDKNDPLDFVLWKAAKPDEPAEAQWPSVYGQGRPGWHIECSAMCGALLGETFDIHGGGADLQFPHHENEIAQSEGANGQPLARFWVHNGFVRVDNEKMSKSLGNFFTIREVLEEYDAETLRFFMVRTHYRSPLNYSDTHLDDARGALKRLYTTLASVPPAPLPAIDWSQPFAQRFHAAMDEDFGTPEAVAVLFDLASEINRSQDAQLAGLLRALGGTLGLLQNDSARFLQGGAGIQALDEAAIAAQKADRIRQALLTEGVALKDSATGTTWERI